jgi:hypothetical protein
MLTIEHGRDSAWGVGPIWGFGLRSASYSLAYQPARAEHITISAKIATLYHFLFSPVGDTVTALGNRGMLRPLLGFLHGLHHYSSERLPPAALFEIPSNASI